MPFSSFFIIIHKTKLKIKSFILKLLIEVLNCVIIYKQIQYIAPACLRCLGAATENI